MIETTEPTSTTTIAPDSTMNIDDWMSYGMKMRWAGPAICSTHDGFPASEAEEELFEGGGETCAQFVRLYRDASEKASIEAANDLSVDAECKGFSPVPEHAAWLAIGQTQGFISPQLCETHNQTPLTPEESAEFEEGDPCVHILRQYKDGDERAAVEVNHPPSVWRQPRHAAPPEE